MCVCVCLHVSVYMCVYHSLDICYLLFWHQDLPREVKGHDIGGDGASVLLRLESHYHRVSGARQELEG